MPTKHFVAGASFVKLQSGPSVIDGTGAFAAQRIPARRKLGHLGGQIISVTVARRRARLQKRVAMVEFGDGFALDATSHTGALRFVNHSCQPNAYMRVAYRKVEFWSLRPIKPGEEITCNYGPTHHDGQLRCRCGAPGCIGFL